MDVAAVVAAEEEGEIQVWGEVVVVAGPPLVAVGASLVRNLILGDLQATVSRWWWHWSPHRRRWRCS